MPPPIPKRREKVPPPVPKRNIKVPPPVPKKDENERNEKVLSSETIISEQKVKELVIEVNCTGRCRLDENRHFQLNIALTVDTESSSVVNRGVIS